MSNTKEMVNHPNHYKGVKYEVIDIIEDFELDFCLGNCIKYVLRCDKKGHELQDLKKAQWYLQRKIDQIESQQKDGITCQIRLEKSH